MSLPTPNSVGLSVSVAAAEYFKSFVEANGKWGPIGEVALLLSERCDDVTRYREVLARHDAHNEQIFRKQILDFVLDFAVSQLDSAPGREFAFFDIDVIKRLLGVRPGEFSNLTIRRVTRVVISELEKVLDDLEISQAEDLELVEIQRAFDLSYDEYLQLIRDTLEAVTLGIGNFHPLVQSQIQHSPNWRANLESIGTLLELARRQPRNSGY